MTYRPSGPRVVFEETTPLANGAEFTSSWYPRVHESVIVAIASDVDLDYFIEFSPDETNVDSSISYTFDASATNPSRRLVITREFFRVRVQNNSGGAQSTFRMEVSEGSFPKLTSKINSTLESDADGLVTRSVITGQNEFTMNYGNVKLSRRDHLLTDIANVSLTSFDELKVARRYSQIELKSAVADVSALRNHTEVTDGAVSVSSTGEYLVETDATLGGNALLESGGRGRYIPGYEAEWGVGIRIPDQTWSGTQHAEWGYFDDNNGLGYGIDATGVYVFILRGGVKTKTYQSSWNKDVLDGTGNSGYTLDLSDGTIFQCEFVWYGYGSIQFYVNMKDSNSERGSVPTLVHLITPSEETSIGQPNLPISVKVDNGDQSTARQVFVGGRQFSIYGNPNEKFRITGERRTNIGVVNTEWRPLISFRRKAGIGNNQTVELTGVNIVPDANVLYTFVTGGTITTGGGASTFGNLTDVTTSETILESNTDADAISGGTFFGGEYVAIGNNRTEALGSLQQLNFDFVNTDTVTLVCRSISISATVEVVTLNAREQW